MASVVALKPAVASLRAIKVPLAPVTAKAAALSDEMDPNVGKSAWMAASDKLAAMPLEVVNVVASSLSVLGLAQK
jgi:hypothetical protein